MNLRHRAPLRYWHSLPADRRETIREALRKIVRANAEKLVSTFYGAFLQHSEGSAFLSHSVVQERLSHSLRNWLLELLDTDFVDVEAFEQRQIQIGEIHARIRVPVHLVLEGASLLKTEVAFNMMSADLDEADRLAAIILLDEIIDYAMRVMSNAYVAGTSKRAHADEAFRLFSLGQDISAERESQRAALMEWCQKILFDLVTRNASTAPQPLGNSQFGLWVRHRANILFHGSRLLKKIEEIIARIDLQILPSIASANEAAATARLIGELQMKIDEIRFLITELFQAATGIESGRDPLTRTLNRKFLASVLSREVSLAKAEDHPLSLIMVDIDRFKSINDAFGHSAGDVVLRQAADLILETVRISDFVFRYGGEEFLIVLVETPREQALDIAERLRAQFEQKSIAVQDSHSTSVTISAGVAAYEGHPDYEFLVRAADRALYEAKRNGRNRVVCG